MAEWMAWHFLWKCIGIGDYKLALTRERRIVEMSCGAMFQLVRLYLLALIHRPAQGRTPSYPLFGAVHADGIVSSDIVGYSTQGIAGGKLNCVALQFMDVGSVDVSSLANLSTSGLTAGVYDTMSTDAPCIMIYDGVSGYDFYYYISDAYDAEGKEVTAWADSNGDAIAGEQALGTGFWLRIPEATCETGTLTQSGAVSQDATTALTISAGLTLAGNPYPTSMNMSKITTAGLVPGVYDTMSTDAPCIMIYDGVSGYDFYYYISDAYDADGKEVTAWADPNGDEVTGNIAGAGEAFWLRSASAGTLTFAL